ncbi:MAG: T9SS type A sorting domain-containing protein, partial [Candidatus Marinimicrobia bacterium]|nr:T9SS type A sorting domain-containing protein [Candidatus Neomarinimicrobiota bacterium]
MHQNYPNPFNPITTIQYDLPEDGNIKLIIYNIRGREVIVLVNGNQEAGYKSIRWNGRNAAGQLVSAGMYFYAIGTNGHSAIRKMVLL